MLGFRKNKMNFLKRKASVLIMAFMLGISNAILEETRTVIDTRVKTEMLQPEEDQKLL